MSEVNNAKETKPIQTRDLKSADKKRDSAKIARDKEFVAIVSRVSNHPLSAFIYQPAKVKFVNKDPEEEIILIVRRHPITMVGWIISVIVMLLGPAILFVIPPLDQIPGSYQALITAVWLLVAFAFGLERFLDWFFHVNVVTDERIFDVNFYGMLHREITDANIDRIEDVTVNLGGMLRTIFNYGDIYVQTSAEIPRILFEAVPQPDKVSQILRKLRVDEEQEKLEGRVR